MKNHGGNRPGSGRKKKEATRVYSARVPVSVYEKVKVVLDMTINDVIKSSLHPKPHSKDIP